MPRSSLASVVALTVATAIAGCGDNECQGKKCHPVTDVLDACLSNNTCTVNGVPTDCTAPSGCLPFNLLPGAVLRIPLDWSAIGTSSTGLTIRANENGVSFSQSTVLFDGMPGQGCTFSSNSVQCSPVSPSVQSISFSYATGVANNLDISMTDLACYAKYPPCEV